MAELISLIVATYNRDDALAAVLRSLSRQTDTDFELIVADDGSGTATARVITEWATHLPVPVKHVWHPDRGFRLAEIRNRAIRASAGRYCVFLDGDCIARPDFVAAHRRLAEPGWFVTGNRILLSRELTERILRAGLEPEKWGFANWIASRRCSVFISAPCAGCTPGNGAARAAATWRSGAATSTPSTASTPPSAVGAARIPTSSSGSSAPECFARTGGSRPACCTCGTRRRIARVSPTTSGSSPT